MQQPSTAASGARCAVHADRTASLVCARCGSFMCPECSEGGAQAQCPKCRALLGGDAFPYSRADYDFGRLWAHAWSSFSREWLMLTLGALVLLAFLIGASLVSSLLNTLFLQLVGVAAAPGSLRSLGISFVTGQVFSVLISMVVQGVAMTGFYRIVMDALLGRRVELGRMFGQLKKLPTYLGTQLVLFVAVTIPTLLYFAGLVLAGLVAIGVDLRNLGSTNYEKMFHPGLLSVVALGSLAYVVAAIIVILPLTAFVVPELVVSDAGVFEVIGRAWRMASGHRLALFGYGVAIVLLITIATFLCFVPVLPALGLGTCLFLSLFLALRNGMGLPAADHA